MPFTKERQTQNNEERALDLIFDRLDDLLIGSKFIECDSILATFDVGTMSTAQLLTVLTATAAAKDRLPNRAEFYKRAKSVMTTRGIDADRLLAGLE